MIIGMDVCGPFIDGKLFPNTLTNRCSAAKATGLGFVCFVVINPCVLSTNRVGFGLLFFHKFSNYSPSLQTETTLIPPSRPQSRMLFSLSLSKHIGKDWVWSVTSTKISPKLLLATWPDWAKLWLTLVGGGGILLHFVGKIWFHKFFHEFSILFLRNLEDAVL